MGAGGLLSRRHMDKLLVLVATGMPGLFRLALFFSIQSLLGMEALGRFASDVSIVLMLGFFTAIGWCSLVMVRVPRARPEARASVMFCLARHAMAWTCCGLGVLFGLRYFGLIYDPLCSGLLLVAFTSFQFLRRYYLAVKNYPVLVAFECALLAGALATLWFFRGHSFGPYAAWAVPALALSWSAAAVGLVKAAKAGNAVRGECEPAARKGLEFGLANFVSGGRAQFLTPLAAHVAGEAYGGLIGLILSILNMVILFPRSMGQYYLPELARRVEAGREFKRILRRFSRYNTVLLLVMSCLLAVSWRLALSWFPQKLALPGSSVVFYGILLFLVVDQYVLPWANSLMVMERSTVLMTMNVTTTVLLAGMLASMPFLPFEGVLILYLSLAAYIATNLIRTAWLYLSCSRHLADMK